VFGAQVAANATAEVKMNGFAYVATDGQTDFIMSAQTDKTLPVLSGLAREYAVFDAWHCSVRPAAAAAAATSERKDGRYTTALRRSKPLTHPKPASLPRCHAQCPCPTNPNREFVMSGTAHGMVRAVLMARWMAAFGVHERASGVASCGS
jgi:hypothetical protein